MRGETSSNKDGGQPEKERSESPFAPFVSGNECS